MQPISGLTRKLFETNLLEGRVVLRFLGSANRATTAKIVVLHAVRGTLRDSIKNHTGNKQVALTGKLIHEIGFKDIQELIDQKVPEHNGLEYKEQVLHPSLKGKLLEDEKDELLTDIVALANALGGYFLIGIGADQQEQSGRNCASRFKTLKARLSNPAA